MKIGFNLNRPLLTPDNFQFARQAGATHAIIRSPGALKGMVAMAHEAGLEVHAIEHFEPDQWNEILLGGARMKTQLAQLKKLIRGVASAGIPVMGYNFSLSGECGRVVGPFARGRAQSLGMNGVCAASRERGKLDDCGAQLLWDRYRTFLDTVLPTAEQEGVILALHPDDQPLALSRGVARLIENQHQFEEVVHIHPSPAHQIVLCIGSVAQMPDVNVYELTDRLTHLHKVASVYVRNVVGKAPFAREVFPDEGDVDLGRIIQILRKNQFDGVIVPDHTPAMQCSAPWHAGMAFAVGYMKGLLNAC